MPENIDITTLEKLLRGNARLLDESLDLDTGGYRMRIRSNSSALLARLADYFSHVVAATAIPDIEIIAIESAVIDTGLKFIDWAREPGKTGRKDAFFDIPGARLVHKVRTGMLFLQSETTRIAAGPCLQYDNQVINFINSQYMNWLQRQGWLICHASALVHASRGFVIAGFSGGGKSTLMLHLLAREGMSYLTNDRLFIHNTPGRILARGIPKLPRVNPGTIVHDPNLRGLISTEQRQKFLQMPANELWELEEKYDVYIDRVYGENRIVEEAPLDALLLLNWQRGSNRAVALERVELDQRRDLLGTIMKSPGPFYQYADGSFHRDTATLDEQAYLEQLGGIKVYEVHGGIDFAALADRWLEELKHIGTGT